MKSFTFSYPTRVYFGEGAAKEALQKELSGIGKTVLLSYGGCSVKLSGVFDEV